MRAASLPILFAAMTLCGCHRPPGSPVRRMVGQKVKVQFRRDALGAATPNGIPPTTDGQNGAETMMIGALKTADRDWIVIERENSEYMIPTQAILSLEFSLPPPPEKAPPAQPPSQPQSQTGNR